METHQANNEQVMKENTEDREENSPSTQSENTTKETNVVTNPEFDFREQAEISSGEDSGVEDYESTNSHSNSDFISNEPSPILQKFKSRFANFS